jgi:hypothetical protein
MTENGASPAATKPKRPRTPKVATIEAAPVAEATPEPAVAEDGASLAAESVDVHRAAVGRVEASNVTVSQGAIGASRADNVSVDRGAVGAAIGERVEVSRGYARSILARQVQMDRAAARVVIAADVRAEQTAIMFLIARKVDGNVRVLLDWRGALAFGAIAGIVFGLLSRARGARAGSGARGKRRGKDGG